MAEEVTMRCPEIRREPTRPDPALVSAVAYGIDALVAVENKLLAQGNAVHRIRITHYPAPTWEIQEMLNALS